MDEGLIFHKTPQGQAEIATPGGLLSAKARRCLIMVDGKKSVAELAALFRAGEAAGVLHELEGAGMIEPEGGGASADNEETTGLTQENFAAVRQRAMREVSDRLGPNGDPLAMKISGCDTPEELRTALRDAERILGEYLGPQYAAGFRRKVGLS